VSALPFLLHKLSAEATCNQLLYHLVDTWSMSLHSSRTGLPVSMQRSHRPSPVHCSNSRSNQAPLPTLLLARVPQQLRNGEKTQSDAILSYCRAPGDHRISFHPSERPHAPHRGLLPGVLPAGGSLHTDALLHRFHGHPTRSGLWITDC
jgi:hypothetical protein